MLNQSNIVLGGVSALHLSDWTDRVPARMEFLIERSRVDSDTLSDIPESQFFERDPQYFERFIRPNCRSLDSNPIPVLAPAWALADAWKSGEWRPGPDDLEVDDIVDAGGIDELSVAFEALEIDLPCYFRNPGCASRYASR